MPRKTPGYRWGNVRISDAEHLLIRNLAAKREVSMTTLLRGLLDKPLSQMLRRQAKHSPPRPTEG